MKLYYVYVLQSEKDRKWYTGYTSDLRRRLDEHSKGLCLATKARRPLKLIYFEASLAKEDALAREHYLKSGMGKRYLRNRLKRYLSAKEDF